MKITFPNLGNAVFAVKAIFDDLSIDYVLPTPSTRKNLELGSSVSPEEICLPFKIMLGGYIECIKKGADTVLITGSGGPCRFGEYCELQMNILRNLGYNIDFIVIDSPSHIGKKEFIDRIKKIKPANSVTKIDIINAIKNGYKTIKLMDKIDKKGRYLAGYEINKGECKSILKECKIEALGFQSGTAMIAYLKSCLDKLDKVNIDKNKNPLKIAIIGEIYNILEPFSNLYLEDKLMDFGVSSYRHLCISWWVQNTVLSPLKLNSLDLRKYSRKYMPYEIGGHGKECIGEAMMAKRQGFDGAIQIFPMGCMPEIVSKSILPTISKDEDFPIMSLIMDEMSGEAGYDTRIEAFVDLLERRKKRCAI